MYIISNIQTYKIWSASKQNFIIELKNEKELIVFLAKFWRKYYFFVENPKRYQFHLGYFNNFFNNFACHPNDSKITYKEYQIFNNERIINPILYWEESFKYFKENEYILNNNSKKKQLHYVFRQGPVPNLYKRHGKRYSASKSKIKHLLILYSIPEYKKYNKKSLKTYDIDHEYRANPIKNWKNQGKYRHQWEKRARYE